MLLEHNSISPLHLIQNLTSLLMRKVLAGSGLLCTPVHKPAGEHLCDLVLGVVRVPYCCESSMGSHPPDINDLWLH